WAAGEARWRSRKACSRCATATSSRGRPSASTAGGTLNSSRQSQSDSRQSDTDAEQLLHRLQRAGQFLPIAGKTEPDVALAVRSEIDAGHAADAPLRDEILD